MGTRGPVPKRNEQRQRRNKESRLQEVPVIPVSASIQPDPDPTWSKGALMIWDAMGKSGQARFYQPTDWAFAYQLCSVVTSFEDSGRANGQMYSSIISACSALMLTEGDRRRIGLQLVDSSENTTDKDAETANKWARKFSTANSS